VAVGEPAVVVEPEQHRVEDTWETVVALVDLLILEIHIRRLIIMETLVVVAGEPVDIVGPAVMVLVLQVLVITVLQIINGILEKPKLDPEVVVVEEEFPLNILIVKEYITV
jgi:hypothetical protein